MEGKAERSQLYKENGEHEMKNAKISIGKGSEEIHENWVIEEIARKKPEGIRLRLGILAADGNPNARDAQKKGNSMREERRTPKEAAIIWG